MVCLPTIIFRNECSLSAALKFVSCQHLNRNNQNPEILSPNVQTWNLGTQWGETQTRFVSTKTEVGSELVRLKTVRQ